MAKLLVTTLGALTAASLVIAACGDEYQDAEPKPGELDGACYANNSCNAGLTCDLVAGVAKCRPTTADGGASSSSSGSSSSSSGGAVDSGSDSDGAADAAPDVVAPTCDPISNVPSPCPGKLACIGSSLECVGLTDGCTGSSPPQSVWAWECKGEADCQNRGACCLSTDLGVDGTDCSMVKVDATDGEPLFTTCKPSCSKVNGESQLCDSNVDCLANQKCRPFKFAGGPSAIQLINLGVCVPN